MRRLRRYQFYFTNDRVRDKFCGFLEGWDLTAREALDIEAGDHFDGVKRYLRGNTCLTISGETLRAERIR